jgi:hypothetical protein
MALSYIWSAITYAPPETELIDTWDWKDLTLDEIIISLEVVSGLKENTKLEVVDDKYLAANNNNGYMRYRTNNSRYRTLSFSKHLLQEIKRQCYVLNDNIKEGIDIDENIFKFSKLITKIATFMEAFHYVYDIYKNDTLIFSSFETVRSNYLNHYELLLRNLMTKNCNNNNNWIPGI